MRRTGCVGLVFAAAVWGGCGRGTTHTAPAEGASSLVTITSGTTASQRTTRKRCGAGELRIGRGQTVYAANRQGPAIVSALRLDAQNPSADLAIGRGDQLLTALGNGRGSFSAARQRTLTSHTAVADFATGDFDGDGATDVAWLDENATDSVWMARGTSQGDLSGAAERVSVGGRKRPVAIAVADFNSDGYADVATANRASRTVTLLLRDHRRNRFVQRELRPPSGVTPALLETGDFNGDARPDLLVGGGRSAVVYTSLRLRGVPQLHRSIFHDRPVLLPIEATIGNFGDFEAGDVNGDGRDDIVGLDNLGQIFVFYGTASLDSAVCSAALQGPSGGSGIQVAPFTINPDAFAELDCAPSCRAPRIALGDIDRDGFADVAVSAAGGSTDVQVFWGSSKELEEGPRLFTTGRNAASVALADINGNGRLDILAGAEDGSVWGFATACACESFWEGAQCQQCNDPRCPGRSDPRDTQLAVGPAHIVSAGADLVRRSERAIRDRRGAHTLAQQLAALASESTTVVIAHPTAKRAVTGRNNGQAVAQTAVTFAVDRVLHGDSSLRRFVVTQEGGRANGQVVQASSAIPFLTLDELNQCSSGAPPTYFWVMFLSRDGRRYRLTPDLTAPARQVDASGGDFVLRDSESGLSLSSSALAAVLRTHSAAARLGN